MFSRLRRGQRGLWLTGVGLALQMIGLGWASAMHSRDPLLTLREGPSFANPSHLLIAAGLVILAIGVVITLLDRLQQVGFSYSGRSVLPGIVVFAFVAATGGVLLAGGDITAGHVHGIGEEEDWSKLTLLEAERSPVFRTLVQTMKAQGTEVALAQFGKIAEADKNLESQGHNFAHALGRKSFEFYDSNAQVAFSHCRETFQSGCYHGVLEAFLSSREGDEVAPEEVIALCRDTVAAGGSFAVKFQCLHGLGHGLTMSFNHDLMTALQHCDYLETDWDRSSCYGGAFMENVVFAGEEDDPTHNHGGPPHRAYTSEDDLLYPCSALANKYLRECYMMQTSVILMYNGNDVGRAFQSCDQAPDEWIPVCYQSMGRDISGRTLRNESESLRLCQLGKPEYASYCFVGAVKNFIDVDWQTPAAFDLCAKVPIDAKEACYNAVGEQIFVLYPDPEPRAAECARANDTYEAVCRRGARVE